MSFSQRLVRTGDGSFTLRHRDFDECYHSFDGASLEAKNLFVDASGFSKSFSTSKKNSHPISVLDIGLGLGYNALCTIDAWTNLPNPFYSLEIVSLEIDRELINSFLSCEAPWQQNWSAQWKKIISEFTSTTESSSSYRARIQHPQNSEVFLTWSIFAGDASSETLITNDPKIFKGSFEFFWQDAFSPSRNPPLWTEQWFRYLRSKASSDAKLMTYSVARPVKDALISAGWEFALIPTTTRKRNWLSATPKALISIE